MDYFYLFLIIGSVLVYLILRFDKQQRRKVNSLVKQTSDVQPLLLMHSLEQKLHQLNEALTKAETEKEVGDRLKKITTDYNRGHINMQTYSHELSQLLEQIQVR